MNVIGILVVLSIFAAIFGMYHAATNTGSPSDFQSQYRAKPKSPRLHFVSEEVKISPHASEPHHLVFHLQRTTVDRAKESPKAPGLSFSKLEKCIPWIPMDNTIFISSAEVCAAMLNRIKSLDTTRDLYLIDANASEAHSTAAMEA